MLSDLLERWTSRRDELRRLHAHVDGATLCEEVIADLQRLDSAAGAESLTLKDAAARSGYSTDHLARLIRQQKITNVGRKHAPRVLASELPRKVADRSPNGYDPDTDARELLQVRR